MNGFARLLICVFFLVGGFHFSTANAQEQTLKFKEEKRKYIVYAPKSYTSNTAKKYALVFNFHGGGMTMREQMLYTNMNQHADKNDYIVVYPQGLGSNGKQDWNVGFGTSYQDGTDDIGFVDALLTQLEKDFRIDSKKIYATGLSRGGFFCQRIAAEMSHRFSAVASVGATLPVPVEQHHVARSEKKAVGVLIAHGTADQVVAWEGKKDGYLSAASSYQYWKKQNGLVSIEDRSQEIDRDPHDGTQVAMLEAGDQKASVSLVKIQGGGHTWAGADEFNIGLPLGKTSRDIDLNEVIWAFFKKHQR